MIVRRTVMANEGRAIGSGNDNISTRYFCTERLSEASRYT
jgi:hypothetical protein